MKRKSQGYNARLDESLGMRNRGPHKQSLSDRRDESKGMEKAEGKRAYSGARSMDKATRERHDSHMRAAHHKFMADHYKRKVHKKK